MNTKSKGEISEAVILAALIKAGARVSLPFGDNMRYDMVVDIDGRFIRVQCKTAWLDRRCGNTVLFRCCSSNPFTLKRTTYVGSADYFAVYSPHKEKIYIVPVEMAPGNMMTIREKMSDKHRQRKNTNFGVDFEFTGDIKNAFRARK